MDIIFECKRDDDEFKEQITKIFPDADEIENYSVRSIRQCR